MTQFNAMPSNIDWSELIRLLDDTYMRGDGALPEETKIHPVVLSRARNTGKIESHSNTATLWNLAVKKHNQGLIHSDHLNSCLLDAKEKTDA